MSAAEVLRDTHATLDVDRIREDFPILREQVHGKPLVYLDNAATSQKPQAVIDSLVDYYSHYNANVHRAVHLLSTRATEACDTARDKVRRFLNAASTDEVIFVRGATEGLNLVAQTHGRRNIRPGDEVLISGLEHHSNIVPWQMLCDEKQAHLRVVSIDDRGVVPLNEFEKALNERTRLVAISHVSNALGTVNPLADMIQLAHRWNVPVVVDGAQAMPHMRVDVRALDADFYAFSGHKLFGPTGIGVLYGKKASARSDASVSGRRRHDSFGHFREDQLQRLALQIRGGHAGHCRHHRPGRGDRLRQRHWHGRHLRIRTRIARVCHASAIPIEWRSNYWNRAA